MNGVVSGSGSNTHEVSMYCLFNGSDEEHRRVRIIPYDSWFKWFDKVTFDFFEPVHDVGAEL